MLSSATTPTIKDWRVMDLELDGRLNGAGGGLTEVIGIYTDGGMNQFTVLRVNAHHVHSAFAFNEDLIDFWNNNGNPGHVVWNELAIVDSTTANIVGGGGSYSVYASAHRFSLLGNNFNNSGTGSHTLRILHAQRAVISNNTIAGAGATQHIIKLHARGWADAGVSNPGGVGTFSEKVVLSDNKFQGGIEQWTVALGPQDGGSDERLRDFIVERNWLKPGSTTQVELIVWAVETTIRNNIFDTTGATAGAHQGLVVERRGIEPASNQVRIYNNTFYNADASSNFVAVDLGSQVTNITMKNNLAYSPGDSSAVMRSGSGASGLDATNNSADSDVRTNNPMFASPTSAPADFMLNAGSYAIDTGASVPVFSDFFRLSRPQNVGFDLGAVERP
jgi:hypothetical protein